MLTIQERLDESCGRLQKSADTFCRALGSGAAQPTQAEMDNLVTAIDACTETAMTLAAPAVAKVKKAPAANLPKGKKGR